MQHSIEYKLGHYKLSINFWFLIIFLLIQTGLNELGFWQLARAEEKIDRLDKLANQDIDIITNLEQVNESSIDNFARVDLALELEERVSILIENKIQNGKLGYHLLHLVRDKKSNKVLLINRGWLEGKADRNELPQVELPPFDWNIEARIYRVNPQVLSTGAELEVYSRIIRLPVMDHHMLSLLEERFGRSIEPYLLRIDEESPAALDVDWAWVSMSPDKHLGYAFQWFGLSFAFLIVSLFASVKKEEKE